MKDIEHPFLYMATICLLLCVVAFIGARIFEQPESVEMTVTDIQIGAFSVNVELDNKYIICITRDHSAWLMILDLGTVLKIPKPTKNVYEIKNKDIKVVK